MTDATYREILAALRRRPSQAEWDDDVEKEWAVVLPPLSEESARAALKRVITECEFRPQPATFLRFVEEIEGRDRDLETLGAGERQIYRLYRPEGQKALPSSAEGPGRQAARDWVSLLPGYKRRARE